MIEKGLEKEEGKKKSGDLHKKISL